ncbi:MAG: hypothetical protein J6A01_08775 [Proteobacteria bacterium]|nr:hypothetical protein [Pseudomonadota bacterium]
MNNKLLIMIGIQVALFGCTLEDLTYCDPNDIKCENINDIGMLYHCTEAGKWGDATPCKEKMQCTEDGKDCQPPTYCTPGETRCENAETGGILKTCDETQHWDSGTPCLGNQKCTDDGSACIAPELCTVGEKRCEDTNAGGILRKCDETRHWDNGTPCLGNQKCTDDGIACLPPELCTVGEERCEDTDSGGILRKCDETQHWDSGTPCLDNQKCKDDGSACIAPELCTAGEERCEDTDSGGILRKCDETQHWDGGVPCKESKKCKDERSCEPPDKCTPQTTQCTDTSTGGFLETCDDDGHWVNQTPCEDNKPCQDAATCVPTESCNIGDTQCVNQSFDSILIGNLSQCESNQKWSSPVACPGNAPCKDKKTCDKPQEDKCKQQPTKCQNIEINDTEYGQLLICDNGTVTPQNCPNNTSCKDESTCGICINGTFKCKEGKTYQCQNGDYEFVEDCATGQCLDETSCLICTQTCAEDKDAIGEVTLTCVGKTPEKTSCSNVSCNPAKTDCGECKRNQSGPATSCRNDASGIGYRNGCLNGEKLVDAPCENGYSCSSYGYTCGDCHNGDIRCTTNNQTAVLQVCEDGTWGGTKSKLEVQCPNNSACNAEGTACEGGENSICIYPQNGNSVGTAYYADGTSKECDDVSCNPAQTDCGNCRLNVNGPSLSCESDSYGIGYLTGCRKGESLTNHACEGNASCNTSSSCGVCHSNDWKCEENTSGIGILYQCKDGDWNNTSYETFICPGKCDEQHTFCDVTPKSVCVTRSGTPEGVLASQIGNSINLSTCPGSYSCDSDHKCGNCSTMTSKRCTDGVVTSCPKGTLVIETCPTGKCKNTSQCE